MILFTRHGNDFWRKLFNCRSVNGSLICSYIFIQLKVLFKNLGTTGCGTGTVTPLLHSCVGGGDSSGSAPCMQNVLYLFKFPTKAPVRFVLNKRNIKNRLKKSSSHIKFEEIICGLYSKFLIFIQV